MLMINPTNIVDSVLLRGSPFSPNKCQRGTCIEPKARVMRLQILLVDDDVAQAHLVRKALETWQTPYDLHVVGSAEAALDFINRGDGYAGAPRPHMTLLDLNLPNEPGFTVLKAIKDDPNLRSIAVIVMSSSVDPSDIARAFDLHSDAYVQKPAEWDTIERLIAALETFWRFDERFVMYRGPATSN
jgi:CheY-like chemotaxis protein